jgi:hypothetical protein
MSDWAVVLGALVGGAAGTTGSVLVHFTGHRARVTERELQLRDRRADAYDHLLSFIQMEHLGLTPKIEDLPMIHAKVVAFGSRTVNELFREWEDLFLTSVSDRNRRLEEKRPALEAAAYNDVASLLGLKNNGEPEQAVAGDGRDARDPG